jgi:protein-disulfide isomerase
MKRYLPFIIIGCVFVLAAGGGWLFYRAKKAVLNRPAINPVAPASSSTSGATPPHSRGRENAAVTLEEFGDYQCPPCAKIAPVIRQMEKIYGERLRVVFRQFPLAMHLRAQDAAKAAEAAGLQNRFWEMHDSLYDNQWIWSRVPDVRNFFADRAKSIGLDVERFKLDMDGDAVRNRIKADRERATSLGLDRTPIIFINMRRVPEASLNEAGLRAAIDTALKEKSK